MKGKRVVELTTYYSGGVDKDVIPRSKLKDALENRFIDAVVSDYGVGPDEEDEEADRDAVLDTVDGIWSNYEVKGDTTIYHYTTYDGETTTWVVKEL